MHTADTAPVTTPFESPLELTGNEWARLNISRHTVPVLASLKLQNHDGLAGVAVEGAEAYMRLMHARHVAQCSTKNLPRVERGLVLMRIDREALEMSEALFKKLYDGFTTLQKEHPDIYRTAMESVRHFTLQHHRQKRMFYAFGELASYKREVFAQTELKPQHLAHTTLQAIIGFSLKRFTETFDVPRPYLWRTGFSVSNALEK